MPTLSDSDRLFIEQRRARKHVGLYVLPALLIIIGIVWVGLFVWWPLAINPNAILGATETKTLDCGQGALTRYALSATVLVNVLLLGFSIGCLVGITRAGRERRYLRMIERLTKEGGGGARITSDGAQPVRQ